MEGLKVEDAKCIINAFVKSKIQTSGDKGRKRNLSNFCRILASGVLISGGKELVIGGSTKIIVDKKSQDPFSLVIGPEMNRQGDKLESLLDRLHGEIMHGLDLKICRTPILTIINNVRKKMKPRDDEVVVIEDKDAYLLELYQLLSINMAPQKNSKIISKK